MADAKRRLPVLRNTPAEEAGEPARPPWQWIAFGVATTLGAWVPMQYVAEALAQRVQRAFLGDAPTYEATVAAFDALSRADHWKLVIATYALRLSPVVLAPLAGGYLMGRWGTDKVGVRECALAGAATALLVSAIVLALPQPIGLLAPLALFAIVVPLSALGGRRGLARRAREMTPNVK